MAIFTNEHDKANVPLLVQLVQVDTTSEVELQHAHVLLTDPEGGDQGGMYTSNDKEGLAVVADVCDIVRRTLHGLATRNAIPADCLLWLEEKREATPNVTYVLMANGGLPQDVLQDVPVDSIDILFPFEQNYSVVERIIYPFRLWVGVAIRDYQRFKHKVFLPCQECENPFLCDDYENPKQIYCSRRCADRVGHRRRYQSRKPKV